MVEKHLSADVSRLCETYFNPLRESILDLQSLFTVGMQAT